MRPNSLGNYLKYHHLIQNLEWEKEIETIQ